jgi:hypothetical protein
MGAASAVSWRGGNYYLHGANVPWVNWACDFGCGSGSGVSSSTSNAALNAKFSQAKAAGMHAIRWWTFEGNPWQVRTDASGTPTALDPAVYADFDAALALAAKYDLYYDFVLFSSPTAIPTTWQTDPAKRAALVNALAPLFARYATNTHVLSWEVFNEPEWDIWNNKIDQTSVQETVRAIIAAVHANSAAYATVGSAQLDGLSMWTGLGLDYYQAHWYDYMSSGDWCALCTDYATVRSKYGLDRPLVIGELYLGTDTPGRLTALFDKGYAGAWPWSLFWDRTNDRLAVDLSQATAFATAHTNIGPLASATSPSAPPTIAPTAAPTPRPTKKPKPSVGPAGMPVDTAPSSAALGISAPVDHDRAPLIPPANKQVAFPAPASNLYHARWFDQTAYPELQPGEVATVTMRFRNTGTAPWIKGAPGRQANLGVRGEETRYVYRTADEFHRAMAGDRASGMSFDGSALERLRATIGRVSELVASAWPTFDRPAIQSEDVVAPGDLGTFTFTVRAPLAPGVYKLPVRLVIDGTVWMEDEGAFILITTLADYHSGWVSQSAYPTVRAGATSAPITVTFRNVGSQPWVKGVLGQQVNLGIAETSEAAAFASGWPTGDRVAMQKEARVAPGETVTFTFQVRAPAKPGTYALRLRPVVDGTMWLEDEGVYVVITVQP